jgi:DNA helicase HerA-like ATPase
MLQLLAELYATCPEEGDLDKPKLVMFIDEAHLIFNDAPKALLEQIETIIKLIRSKGIGVFFATQNPVDIPQSVLAQLGLKVQHALRAFTAVDRKAIKQAAENYPISEFYKTDEVITKLGIGEAFITTLNEKGIPTPLVHTIMMPPKSRMDILSDNEVADLAKKSKLSVKYNKAVDSESAYEILTQKLQAAQQQKDEKVTQQTEAKKATAKPKAEKSWVDSPVVKQAGRTATNLIVRSLLGVLGLGGTTRRRSKSLF